MKKRVVIAVFLLLFSFVGATAQTKEVGIRGTWITNVASDALMSNENIEKAVQKCADLGLNTIGVVVWNKAMTMYPSKVNKKVTGVEIDPVYGKRDPLKEVIQAAHKRNIKVIAWFEFGFSTSFKDNGGILIKKNPDWAALDTNGKLVTKNGFEWMNGFKPEVQNFVLSLITEVVKNYDVDAIQGDDRLPAMPSESGYDKYTVNLYKKAHNGNNPPRNTKDSCWVQWRADILNAFMKKIYTEVKKIKKNVIVSMAPSIYSWCKEEYLQDWPSWVKNGWVELVIPQIYRDNLKGYELQLAKIVKEQIAPEKLKVFYPGVLIKTGDSKPTSEDLIKDIIELNRKYGVNGEFYFYYEGLQYYENLLKDKYKIPAEFPDLLNK